MRSSRNPRSDSPEPDAPASLQSPQRRLFSFQGRRRLPAKAQKRNRQREEEWPKDKSKRLTDSELGRLDFEAWEKHPDDMTPINGENWHARGVDVRFAHAVTCMSKEGLIDLHATVDQDHVDGLIANIMGTRIPEIHRRNVESALHRIIISGCAALDRGIMGDGKQPLNLKGFDGRPKLVVKRPR